jgi:NAD(P)-dependent dehydrogenase (short-subunit alcohol dehydrogenase family)
MTTIAGSVVLVTGANGGLGSEFVRQALALGAGRVYATARIPRDWHDDRVIPLHLDVTDPDSVEQLAQAAPDVNIVINNAGIARSGSLLDGPFDDARDQMETNFFGPLLVARAFAPALRARHGALVNISSVLAWYPVGEGYSTSKAALWSATNAMRVALAPAGVQVLGAYLAQTDTPMMSGRGVEDLNDPADVVRDIYAGLEAGVAEVLADELTVRVRASLSQPVAAA